MCASGGSWGLIVDQGTHHRGAGSIRYRCQPRSGGTTHPGQGWIRVVKRGDFHIFFSSVSCVGGGQGPFSVVKVRSSRIVKSYEVVSGRLSALFASIRLQMIAHMFDDVKMVLSGEVLTTKL